MTMSGSPQQQVTQLLCEWRSGDQSALNKLIPLVQPELQRLAHHYMSRERPGHTLQTTALLDDAYLQLADKTHPQWRRTAHISLLLPRNSCAASWSIMPASGTR